MEVSDAIALARAKSESMSRLARVLSRLKSTIYATGTTIRLRDDELTFYCPTEADAAKLADELPVKLELAYRGASTTLYATHVIQEVEYHFEVPTIRKIRLPQCVLKRSRPRMGGRRSASLLFCELELAKIDFFERINSTPLKEKLWNIAIRDKDKYSRLSKFDFAI
jgi:hypothetical protein